MKRFLVFLAVIGLVSCGRGQQQSDPAQPPSSAPPPASPPTKIEPQAKTLVVQTEASPRENDFANEMSIPVDGSKRAVFSFDFFPQTTGTLTLDTASHFLVEPLDCGDSGGRSRRFDLTWSRVCADGRLEKLTGYSVYVNHYPFSAGQHYRLTYTLEEFDEWFAGCRAVRIRFALHERKPD